MSLDSLKELLGRRTPGPWRIPVPPRGGIYARTVRVAITGDHDAAAIVALSNAADELVAVAQAAGELAKWAAEARGHYGIEECGTPGKDYPTEWDEIQDALQRESDNTLSALSALYDALGGERG